MKLVPFEDAWIVIDESNSLHVPYVALKYTLNLQSIVQLLPFGATSLKFLQGKLPSATIATKPSASNVRIKDIFATSSKGNSIVIEHLVNDLEWLPDKNLSCEIESSKNLALVFCTFANDDPTDKEEPLETCITAIQFCEHPKRAHALCQFLKNHINDVQIIKDSESIQRISSFPTVDRVLGPDACWLCSKQVAAGARKPKRAWIHIPTQNRGGKTWQTCVVSLFWGSLTYFETFEDFIRRKRKFVDLEKVMEEEKEENVVGTLSAVGAGAGPLVEAHASISASAFASPSASVSNVCASSASDSASASASVSVVSASASASASDVSASSSSSSLSSVSALSLGGAKKRKESNDEKAQDCSDFNKLIKMFEDCNWMLDPCDVELEVNSTLTCWELNTLMGRISFEQKSRIPKGVFDGERCSICWNFGHLLCEECRQFRVCQKCFETLKESEVLCIRCVFESQVEDLEACLEKRLPLHEAM